MKRSVLICAAAATSLAIGLVGLGGMVYAQTPPAAPQVKHDRGPGRMGGPAMARMGMMMHAGRPAGPFGLLEFDANGDGKLTKAEFDAAQHARFNDMDANKDGFVVPEEAKAYREKVHADAEAARFQIMDTDRNGQISKAEFDAAAKSRKDDAGPGMRGPGGAGFRHMRASFTGGQGGPGFGPPGGGRRGPPGADRKPADASQPQRAGPMDANADGKISFEEFSGRATAAFARADLNKDNIVTIAELQTLTKAMR